MNIDQIKPHKFASSADFLRFLIAMGGHNQCSFCGNQGFQVNIFADPVTKEEFPAAVFCLPFSHDDTVHSFFSVGCARCGKTDFFHVNQVTAWLSANPMEASNG